LQGINWKRYEDEEEEEEEESYFILRYHSRSRLE
jgi:hypothetical protein